MRTKRKSRLSSVKDPGIVRNRRRIRVAQRDKLIQHIPGEAGIKDDAGSVSFGTGDGQRRFGLIDIRKTKTDDFRSPKAAVIPEQDGSAQRRMGAAVKEKTDLFIRKCRFLFGMAVELSGKEAGWNGNAKNSFIEIAEGKGEDVESAGSVITGQEDLKIKILSGRERKLRKVL